MAPRVSVVISTTDRALSLRKTLNSLRQLDYEEFEVIVVCGPCTDETRSVLAKFGDQVRVGECSSRNLSASRNIGIAMAAGDYVAFIEDGACPEPVWLDRLIARFGDPHVAVVGGPVVDHTGVIHQTRQLRADQFGNRARLGVDAGTLLSFPGTSWAPYAMGTNGIYRRDLLVVAGGFDEEFEFHLGEIELCRRLVERGYVVSYAEEAVVHHHAPQSIHCTAEPAVWSRLAVLKSKCYFALRHGLRTSCFSDVCSDLAAFVDQQRAEVEQDIAVRALDPRTREVFESDVAEAFDLALSRYRSGSVRTRPRAWFEERRGAFRRFPILRPPGDKLHVCLLTDEYLPAQLNGIARTVHTLATGLAERGHLVRVLARGDEPGQVDLQEGVWVHRVPIRHHDCPRDFPVPPLWAYSASLLDELVRIDRVRAVDLVQASNWGALAVAAMRDGRFKTVLSLHTPLKTVAAMDHRLQRLGRPRREIRRLIQVESSTYDLPTAYLASSPSVVQEIEERYGRSLDPERTGIVGHGLADLAGGRQAEADGESVDVLFVGRLEPRKGIDVLLDCIPGLADRFPHLVFTVVGDDTIKGRSGATYRQAFERSEAGRRLAGRVRFTGVVDEAELAKRYAACDIFVAPSRYESFGLILLEAMMFGKPVIACDAGGMARIVEHESSGLLVEPGDARALQGAIARLAGSRELRRRFGRRSRELYEQRYSSARMVEETNAFYDRLLGRASAAAGGAPGANGLNRRGAAARSQDIAVAESGLVRTVAAGRPQAAPLPGPAAAVPRSSGLRPLADSMRCPRCGAALRLVSAVMTADGRTKTGQLVCDTCGRVTAMIDQFRYDFLIHSVDPLVVTETRRVPALGERRVHHSDVLIRYQGDWRPSDDGYVKSTSRPGDAVSLSAAFTDAQVRLLRHAHGGIADVFCDHRHVATVDLCMPEGFQVVPVIAAADLPLEEHTLGVRARGTAHPESRGRYVSLEEIVLFAPLDASMGFAPAGPINRGNPYPDVVRRYIAQTPEDEWILECGGGDRRLGARNIVNLEYMKFELADIHGDAHQMPFEDGTFSMVFTQAVFEHLRNPFEVAKELIRVTRPGGLIVTEVAFMQPLHAAPYHYFNMTIWGVEELFAGCTVVETGWQGSLALTVDWLMKSVNLDSKIPPSRFARITREFERLDKLISHEELRRAASGVWVVVRREA